MSQRKSAIGRVSLVGLAKSIVLAGVLGVSAWSSAIAAPPPPLPIEQSDVAQLPPFSPHRFYLLNAFSTGMTTIVDGDDPTLKTIGSVPGSWNGIISVPGNADKIYIAETYWSHGNRGTRADLLSVYDGKTLKLEREIPIPGRLITNPKTAQIAISTDAQLAYVYDMVPASAIHIVDLAQGKLLTSADVPGCALVHAYGKRSFATLCGDGTLGFGTVPAEGKPKLVFTKPFFKADQDPVFDNSIIDRDTGQGWLITYSGHVIPVQLGPTPVIGKPWSITMAAGMPESGTGVQELAWRPGGAQFVALHRATRRLCVLMHPGNYWTQKSNGTEVWVLDTDKHKLINRIKLADPGYGIAITQDDKPLLFVIGAGWSGSVAVYDMVTGAKLRERKLPGFFGQVPGL